MSVLKELGLRTPKDADDPKTRRFLEIVQSEAAALNKVFLSTLPKVVIRLSVIAMSER